MSQGTTSARKINRTIRLGRVPTELRPGKVIIADDDKATTYLVHRLASEIGGLAFRLEKIQVEQADDAMVLSIADAYDVLLNGRESTCDCKWGTYGGHKKPCRHIAGLLKLQADGKLS